MSDGVLQRYFLTIATSSYDDQRWAPLPDVDHHLASIKQWLCNPILGSRQFTHIWPELAEDPTEDQVYARLRNLARDGVWSAETAVFIVVAGHTAEQDGSRYVVLRDSDPNSLHSSALRISDLVSWIADTGARHVAIVFDMDQFLDDPGPLGRLGRHDDRHWFVLPGTSSDGLAKSGSLLAGISRFADELLSPEGRRYGEGPYISPSTFFDDVQSALREDRGLGPLQCVDPHGAHVCLPNPHQKESETVATSARRSALALPLTDLETHWGPRSRGVATDGEGGWLFSGRANLMRALIDSATGPPRTTVVTGGAGSGKSAALARLVTLSDGEFLRNHAVDVATIPEELRPPTGAVDTAVLATGKLPSQVLAQLCGNLGVRVPNGDRREPTIDDQVEGWHSWLTLQQRAVTVVIDALDEATDPRALVHDVLTRLEPDPNEPRLRLIVGIRSVAAADGLTGGAVRPDTTSLVDLTLSSLRAKRLAVDELPWWDQNDVALYVQSILMNTPRSPYPKAGPDVAQAVASAVGARAGRSFLIARIAAASLAVRDKAISHEDAEWLAALDQGVLGVFRDDLRHTLAEPTDRRRAVVLLRAIAYARGVGLPWRGVWPLVANAVDDGGGQYGDSDVSWLLDSRLGGYLVTDRDGEATVYRLFHDQLRSTLRERWQDLLRAQ